MKNIIVAGGGIAGMAAAVKLKEQGHGVMLLEQASAFSEVGAGLQLGPNAVRVLDGWGLGERLRAVGSRPEAIRVLQARNGALLAEMPLGDGAVARYGSDYLTIHRADLHRLLAEAARERGVEFHLSTVLRRWSEDADGLAVVIESYGVATTMPADALIGADGIWSTTRQQLLRDGKPTFTGHVAYRALVEPQRLPTGLHPDAVTVWLGRAMHAVAYPIRGGQVFNLVIVVERSAAESPENWRQQTGAAGLTRHVQGQHAVLTELVQAGMDWKLWSLHVRPMLSGPQQMAQGRVALIGDASHAMRPYLAQGAAMAIEDVEQLRRSFQLHPDAATALAHCAQARWQRNAQVQARSQRNGDIFHAWGPVAWARNLAMRIQGEKLMDLPWLYGHGASAGHATA